MAQDRVVGYCWYIEDKDTGTQEPSVEQQKQVIMDYCGGEKKLEKCFVEAHDRRRRELPEFERAVAFAQKHGATLVIAQLQNLTRYPAFTDPLIAHKVSLYCIDQPLVNDKSLPAVVANVRYLRERHSRRIRQGLEDTLAQLGNPHALQEITKVNKPKTESAVLFALVLAPIIAYYRIQGYSQRKMVQALNDEGFLAPEGGPWVLSQLQKVLERVDLNNAALDLCDHLDEFSQKQYTEEQMLKTLKAMRLPTPDGNPWDAHTLNKVIDRLHTIREILEFNQFVLEIYPVMLQYRQDNLSDGAIAAQLNEDKVPLPERVVWELRQDEASGQSVILDRWTAENVELTMRVAQRRKQDIESYIRPDTLARSEALFKTFTGETPESE